MKAKCECGKEAKWYYMPSSTLSNPYYCEECVPRGCSCRNFYINEKGISELPPLNIESKWKWIIENSIWCYIDEEGREFPCVEFDFDSNGHNLL